MHPFSLPPLVEPVAELSRDQLERYSRHLLVPGIGVQGQRRLVGARVLVVGAGGLGCPALVYLAAAGVGSLTVVDHDVVDVSNLQRQVLHRTEDIGVPKARSAARALHELNPLVQVRAVVAEVDAAGVHDLVRGHDLVVDGSDNFTTRYLVGDACAELGVPVVWAAVLRFDAQVATFVPAPWVPAQDAVSLRDLYPTAPPPEAVPTCGDAGVLGALCGQVGAIMATEAVKLITGVGEPLVGRVLLLDVAAMRMREIPLRPAPGRGATPGQAAHPAPGPAPGAGAEAEPWTVLAPVDLAETLAGERPPVVLDVREPAEHVLGTVEGAHRVPLAEVLAWQDLRPVGHGTVVVTCKTGPRAERAARHLCALGHPDVRVLDGGMRAWTDEVDPSLVRY